MINVLLDGMQPYRDINDKNCTALKYSQGGSYLAVAKNQNISIYSVYTGEFLSGFNLRAHSSAIPFIAWHPNDLGLFSIGKDGQLNEWHLENSH